MGQDHEHDTLHPNPVEGDGFNTWVWHLQVCHCGLKVSPQNIYTFKLNCLRAQVYIKKRKTVESVSQSIPSCSQIPLRNKYFKHFETPSLSLLRGKHCDKANAIACKIKISNSQLLQSQFGNKLSPPPS